MDGSVYRIEYVLLYRVNRRLLTVMTAELQLRLKQVRITLRNLMVALSRVTDFASSDHTDVCQILKSRMTVLKQARAEWSVSEPKVRLSLGMSSVVLSCFVCSEHNSLTTLCCTHPWEGNGNLMVHSRSQGYFSACHHSSVTQGVVTPISRRRLLQCIHHCHSCKHTS